MNARRDKNSGISFCHAGLPNAGLGNKLLVWAKAMVFARINDLPLVVTGWTTFQLAPILQGRDLRLYWNYFRRVKEVNWFRRVTIRRRARIVDDPPLSRVEGPSQPTIYTFRRLSHWSDYFGDLKPHRELVRDALFSMLTPARRRELERLPKAKVCIQVRMGDFFILKPGQDFAKVGGTRTPLAYFVKMIEGIREIHGSQLPVTILSDGSRDQLRELLAIPAVELGSRQTAIVDIFRMARGRVLIPSAGSTFGYWGGFLGDCAMIMHPDHIHKSIRPDSVNERYYEGPALGPPQQWPELLQQNIRAIGAV
ncbi:MAG: hypothetical protein ABSA47_00240 [Verrucomicrobiota bacterium]